MTEKTVQKIDIFISSPGDVAEERKVASEVIEQLNSMSHIADRFMLKPLAYEKEVPAAVGESPQKTVDRYMMEANQADIFICILWSRMGTPVIDEKGKEYQSGTEYEFTTAYRAKQKNKKPAILLYRSMKGIPPDADTKQLGLVQDFFKRFEGKDAEFKGLYKKYENSEDFRKTLFQDIDKLISSNLIKPDAASGAGIKAGGNVNISVTSDHADPSQEDRRRKISLIGKAVIVVLCILLLWFLVNAPGFIGLPPPTPTLPPTLVPTLSPTSTLVPSSALTSVPTATATISPTTISLNVTQLKVLKSDRVNQLAWSPDGKLLAIGGYGVYLNDITTFQQTCKIDIRWVNSVTFSPDGQKLATASNDGIKMWKVDGCGELGTFAFTNDTNSVAFSPDGTKLAAGVGMTVKLFDVKTMSELKTFIGHRSGVNSVVFSSDGQTLASGSDNVKLWDVASGQEFHTLDQYNVKSIAFSPDGKILASGSATDNIKLWNVTSGNLLRTLTGHTSSIDSVAFSPDGKMLASASWDLTVRLWDIGNGKELRKLTGHTEWLRSISFSPDGSILASGGNDKTVRLWGIVS